MSSPSKPSFSEFSASQPIASPSPCSDCGVASQATCPACDVALCLAHIYVCPDCNTALCAFCLAPHRADDHWSDSDTAAELQIAHGVRNRQMHIHNSGDAQPPNPTTDATIHHHSHFPFHFSRIPSEGLPKADAPESSPLPHPQSAQIPKAPQPILDRTDSRRSNEPASQHLAAHSPISTFAARSNASALLQRLRSHIRAQAESRHLAFPPLHACVYIQIFCVKCGYMRQALHEMPGTQTTSCPGCARQRPFVALGIGFTSRALPFHERFFLTGHAPHQHPWKWLCSPNSERRHRRRAPTRSLDSETRDFLHRHLERFRQIADSMLRST